MEYIEITAKTVNDAITKACMQMGIPSDRLDIQVVSEGSKGFFGIGNKPAVIKVAEKKEEAPVEPKKEKTVEKAKVVEKVKAEEPVRNIKSESPEAAEKKENVEKEESSENRERKPRNNKRRDNRRRDRRRKEKPEFQGEFEEKKAFVEEKREPLVKTEEEIAAMKKSAEDFLKDVFGAMEIPAEISMEYREDVGCLEVNVIGDDMGILIGKRGQTLDSLQYLTSLVVNKDQKDYIRVKLDTEDYRRRRKETLENLAKNIASKVKKTGKTVVLEPMNPYERRIIHSALQPNKYVETYSDGKEPYRHIVVAPRRRKEQES